MKVTRYEAFAIALAAPVVRHQGANDRVFGGEIEPEHARNVLRVLFRIESADDAVSFLESTAEHGQRAEWTQYATHTAGGWKPGPEDHAVTRKTEFVLQNAEKLGQRGLLALDAMRAASIAGWCERAGYLGHADALRAIGLRLLKRTADEHRSWEDLAEQLRLAFGFTEGAVPKAMEAVIASLLTDASPWNDTNWPSSKQLRAPAKAKTKKVTAEDGPLDPNRPLAIVAFALSLDCRGCGAPASVLGLAPEAVCALCGSKNAVEPSWDYYLKDDVANRKLGVGEDDPITNDFGDAYFSRRDVRQVTSIRCACGNVLPTPTEPGDHACNACGGGVRAREADPAARSIDPNARWIVESIAPTSLETPSFPCAACGASLSDASAPIVRCTSCDVRTFVDDATWQRVHGSPRRRTTYVLLAW